MAIFSGVRKKCAVAERQRALESLLTLTANNRSRGVMVRPRGFEPLTYSFGVCRGGVARHLALSL